MGRTRRKRARDGDGDGDGEDDATTGGLDDDTLLHIFDRISTRELLTRAALVCRRWNRLCQSHVREIVPRFGDFSRWLHSSVWLKPKDVIKLARKHASTITSITFPRSQKDAEKIVSTVSALPHLRHLSAAFSDDNFPPYLAEALSPHLQSLDVFSRDHDVSSFFLALPSRCPHLHTLKLLGASVTWPNGDLGVTLKSFTLSLTTLHISSSDFGWDHVNNIFKCCSNLSDLGVVSSDLLILDHASISPMPPSLTSLRLCVSPGLSVAYDRSAPWKLIKDSGRQLQALYAESTFSGTWQAICKACTNLKVLDLSTCDEVVITQLEEKALCKIPFALRNLEKVCLPTASDNILVQFGRFCSHLIEFELNQRSRKTGAYNVQDKGIMALVEGCNKLQVMSLVNCTNITHRSMRFIAFHCPCLRALNLFGCKLIDDEAVAILVPRLSNSLYCLNLDCCPRISAATLEFFRERASKVELLVIHKTLHNKLGALIKCIKADHPLLNIKAGAGSSNCALW
ncbi:F-box/LRR-repeat protein 4-like [Selaginella moellendorffii]|uniref:F-box/LRR-repeat protein 4-like n=1 Tax=Selaginella moellendorffii TaxID=88036 RepID=UPI000D1CBEE0|nr:F-box/LRR-repeat protein 4-like [Selaginella moellendorffii]|eukprot:XP_024521483.1 F-box/LRR-repeat protein 4-like [Selaginella moellendorffii]